METPKRARANKGEQSPFPAHVSGGHRDAMASTWKQKVATGEKLMSGTAGSCARLPPPCFLCCRQRAFLLRASHECLKDRHGFSYNTSNTYTDRELHFILICRNSTV